MTETTPATRVVCERGPDRRHSQPAPCRPCRSSLRHDACGGGVHAVVVGRIDADVDTTELARGLHSAPRICLLAGVGNDHRLGSRITPADGSMGPCPAYRSVAATTFSCSTICRASPDISAPFAVSGEMGRPGGPCSPH
jgi:hypothetical protein